MSITVSSKDMLAMYAVREYGNGSKFCEFLDQLDNEEMKIQRREMSHLLEQSQNQWIPATIGVLGGAVGASLVASQTDPMYATGVGIICTVAGTVLGNSLNNCLSGRTADIRKINVDRIDRLTEKSSKITNELFDKTKNYSLYDRAQLLTASNFFLEKAEHYDKLTKKWY